MKAFGMPEVRGQIIHYLALTSEGDTSGSIARKLGVNYHTVLRHLQELEQTGVVISDGDDQRAGRRLIYQVDKDALSLALDEATKFLMGENE